VSVSVPFFLPLFDGRNLSNQRFALLHPMAADMAIAVDLVSTLSIQGRADI